MRGPGRDITPSLFSEMEADASRHAPPAQEFEARPARASWKFPKPAKLDWGFTGDFIRSGRQWALQLPLLIQQERALEEADLKPAHTYFIDAGGGKTGVCIAEASLLWAEGKIDGMIVLAPLGPHEQWITEQFPLLATIPWRGAFTGMSPTKLRDFFGMKVKQMPVLALHYDMLRTRQTEKLLKSFTERWPRYYLAIDESSRIKTPSAQRTRATFIIARQAAFRRPLSGTPMLNGLENLWSQYEVAERGLTGFPAYTGFRSFYCVTKPIPGARSAHAQMIVGYRNQQQLISRVRNHTTRIEASEFKKGPKPTFVRVDTPMNARQREAYESMRNSLRVDLGDTTIEAQNILTKIGKLHQIAQGMIMDEGNVTWLSTAKLEAVTDLLDSLDEPLIIFAPFRAQIAEVALAIRQRNDRPVFVYEGRADVDQWKEAGGVIIGNQGSGLGIGQNLQNAAATIYMANTRSPEHRIQSLARTDRTGQLRQVRYWDILTPDTVDPGILRSLEEGQDFAENFLRMIRSGDFEQARRAL